MVLRRRPSFSIPKGDPRVLARAMRLANQEMRVQVLPSLGMNRIRATSWNPLRLSEGQSAYGMKLWINDKLAREILQDDKLMQQTEQIVIEAVMAAATDLEPAAFVQSLLDHVKSDTYDTAAENH